MSVNWFSGKYPERLKKALDNCETLKQVKEKRQLFMGQFLDKFFVEWNGEF